MEKYVSFEAKLHYIAWDVVMVSRAFINEGIKLGLAYFGFIWLGMRHFSDLQNPELVCVLLFQC